MKLSVLLPTKNGAHTLESTLNSLLASTSMSFEVIVSDNNSTDSTNELIKRCQDERVKAVVQKNDVPLWLNWAHCLDMASGEFVMSIGDDDRVSDHFIDIILEQIESDKQFSILTFYHQFVDDQGAKLGGWQPPVQHWGYQSAMYGLFTRDKLSLLMHGVIQREILQRSFLRSAWVSHSIPIDRLTILRVLSLRCLPVKVVPDIIFFKGRLKGAKVRRVAYWKRAIKKFGCVHTTGWLSSLVTFTVVIAVLKVDIRSKLKILYQCYRGYIRELLVDAVALDLKSLGFGTRR